mmetsp:Transcript_7121/g.11528  ORF Transcript_7121/g.11528 Transcript_7121/m.11528 type:complete len:266 (+) Transcript_7121:151-948(+)
MLLSCVSNAKPFFTHASLPMKTPISNSMRIWSGCLLMLSRRSSPLGGGVGAGIGSTMASIPYVAKTASKKYAARGRWKSDEMSLTRVMPCSLRIGTQYTAFATVVSLCSSSSCCARSGSYSLRNLSYMVAASDLPVSPPQQITKALGSCFHCVAAVVALDVIVAGGEPLLFKLCPRTMMAVLDCAESHGCATTGLPPLFHTLTLKNATPAVRPAARTPRTCQSPPLVKRSDAQVVPERRARDVPMARGKKPNMLQMAALSTQLLT